MQGVADREYRVQWSGSRGWLDPMTITHLVTRVTLAAMYRGAKLRNAHGGADGVDTMVSDALRPTHSAEIWRPDWEQYGRRAGILRNEEMIDEFEPHLGIGLNWNGSKGTAHAVRYMKSKGIPLLSISYDNDPEGKFFPF